MTDKERINKALDVINKFGFKGGIDTPDEIYADMKDYSLYEIAQTISKMQMAVMKVKGVLTGELE